MPAITLESRESRARGLRAKGYLVGYLFLLVVSTHWPNSWPLGGEPSYPDKPVHFFAYSVLAFLAVPVAGVAAARDRRRFWLVAVLIWFAVAAFGLLDEATQPLTGRDFEWLDWLADGFGAICGLLVGNLWFRSRPSVRAAE